MIYYHCSPIEGLKELQPRKPLAFDKPARVYMATLLPMALMYGVRNYEYTYGYNKEGRIYFAEHFPGMLKEMYKGKSASLYVCAPENVGSTAIPNEATSESVVPIVEERRIPDVYEALLEQEREGALIIHRYHDLTPSMLAWVLREETKCIVRKNLTEQDSSEAAYYRTHYPDAWEAARLQRSCE